MDTSAGASGRGRDRRQRDGDESSEADEQFARLLEGLRTTLPGVQVLFGFLLVFPLQANFSELTDFEKPLYVVALLSAAVALILLIAPSVHQRMRAPIDGIPRHHVRHVKVGAYLAIGGSIAASLALVASTWLALTIVYGTLASALLGSAVALLAAWSWFWIPLRTFAGDK